MPAHITPFGTTDTGETVQAITLRAADLYVVLLTWGAVLQDVRLRGIGHSLTMGSDSLADYQGDMRYHGSLIGPVANRISGAKRHHRGADRHGFQANRTAASRCTAPTQARI